MNRIEPRHVPPTITHGSGLNRDYIDGRIHPMIEPPIEKGRYLLAMLVLIFITGTLAVAAFS